MDCPVANVGWRQREKRWSLRVPVKRQCAGIRDAKMVEVMRGSKQTTVKPPIIPTPQTSIPLLIPVCVEPPYLTYGKSLSKFHTSYSFLFQGIGQVLIPANAYLRKVSVKIGLKKRKKSAGKRRKEEKKTNNPVCMKVRRCFEEDFERSKSHDSPWRYSESKADCY